MEMDCNEFLQVNEKQVGLSIKDNPQSQETINHFTVAGVDFRQLSIDFSDSCLHDHIQKDRPIFFPPVSETV